MAATPEASKPHFGSLLSPAVGSSGTAVASGTCEKACILILGNMSSPETATLCFVLQRMLQKALVAEVRSRE